MQGKDYNGQLAQDYFVMKVLKGKQNGTFLEIGANHPINISNTYLLEKTYGWRGIMVEYDGQWLGQYKQHRPNSSYVMGDATQQNYEALLQAGNYPNTIDFLQIDLEVNNRSTLTTLELIEMQVMPTRKFAVVTFEHDIYSGNHFDTRAKSREIFERNGYYRVYSDVGNTPYAPSNPTLYQFEDWYVHPDLVDMEYIHKIENSSIHHFQELVPLW